MKHAAIAALLTLATTIPASANECERGARQIWNRQQVESASETRKLNEMIALWKGKLQNFSTANREVQGIGRYGDGSGSVLEKEPFLPSKLVSERRADLARALEVRQADLDRVRQQRQNDQSDFELYCEKVHATVAHNALALMKYNAELSETLYRVIELYFELRVAVASAVSREKYAEELSNARRAIAELYEKENKPDEMMNFFLSY